MPFTLFGNEFHSIAASGPAIFTMGPIGVGLGDVVIDLVSAPLPPGEHRLEVWAGLGDVEIYLPRYVQFTVDGFRGFGETKIHDGLTGWKATKKKLARWLDLPDRTPEHALQAPKEPISLKLVVQKGFGDIEIYRLSEVVTEIPPIEQKQG